MDCITVVVPISTILDPTGMVAWYEYYGSISMCDVRLI